MFGSFQKKQTGGFAAAALVFRALILVGLGILTLTGCQRAFSVIFDLPERTASPQPVANAFPPAHTPSSPADTLRPPIEEVLVADSVKQMLPKDHAGNIDWMAALRDGTIQPRDAVNASAASATNDTGFEFGFDFHFAGPAPMFDAYFPHSAHTQWVNCQQCHGPIFKYRDTEFQMADVLAGKYCGECHGKVSFPPVTACERCHLDMPQPANRAQPLLLGTIRMTRVSRADSLAQGTSSNNSPADSISTEQLASTDQGATQTAPAEVLISEESLPPAVFPHWVHRIRFTCKACHMELFEPRAGANEITMQDISAGKACGTCHNGSVAFDAGFGECQRCHTPIGSESM